MAGSDRAAIHFAWEMVMNRLRAWWNVVWFDALVIAMLICVAGAVAELALAWATAP